MLPLVDNGVRIERDGGPHHQDQDEDIDVLPPIYSVSSFFAFFRSLERILFADLCCSFGLQRTQLPREVHLPSPPPHRRTLTLRQLPQLRPNPVKGRGSFDEAPRTSTSDRPTEDFRSLLHSLCFIPIIHCFYLPRVLLDLCSLRQFTRFPASRPFSRERNAPVSDLSCRFWSFLFFQEIKSSGNS